MREKVAVRGHFTGTREKPDWYLSFATIKEVAKGTYYVVEVRTKRNGGWEPHNWRYNSFDRCKGRVNEGLRFYSTLDLQGLADPLPVRLLGRTDQILELHSRKCPWEFASLLSFVGEAVAWMTWHNIELPQSPEKTTYETLAKRAAGYRNDLVIAVQKAMHTLSICYEGLERR
jgi:hypothetical protein